MLAENLLSRDSAQVNAFLQKNVPEYFSAAIAGPHIPPHVYDGDSSHQDKITAVLTHLGNSDNIRKQVEAARKQRQIRRHQAA